MNQESYPFITRLLHWLIFLLILLQATCGILFDDISKPLRQMIMPYHKSFGLLLLALVILFIIVRLCTPKPAWPVTMPKWERIIAKIVHLLLYLCLLLMPLSGWLMSSAAGYAPYFFGLGPIPMPFVPQDKALAGFASDVHSIVIWILIGLAALHILAALKHHFLKKDDVLKNIWFGSSKS